MTARVKKMLALSVGTIVSFPLTTLAAYSLGFDSTVGSVTTPLKAYSRLGSRDPTVIAFTIINTALIFLGLITVVLVLVGGFMWIFAAGEEDKIKKAKDILKGSVVGLVIVLGSYGISNYVFAALRYATTG